MSLVDIELQTLLFKGVSSERRLAEAELSQKGISLPLRARCVWADAFPDLRNELFVVRGSSGLCGALAWERHPSHALAGHEILRAWHVGATLPGPAARVAISALSKLVREDSRILRAHVETYSASAEVRSQIGTVLAACGFQRLDEPTNYRSTLLTALDDKDDSTHFASLTRRVRQDIRAIEKFPIALRRIFETDLSVRMNALLRESLARTGGIHKDVAFEPIIQLSQLRPDLSTILGLFRTDVIGSESLIAFAWGINQGDVGVYDVGASTRVPEFKNLSLGYPLVWGLIAWARSVGLPSFDFGGVTPGSSESDDRLGRISDFKRRFSKDVVDVAEEWVYAPHLVRNAVASAISKVGTLVRR